MTREPDHLDTIYRDTVLDHYHSPRNAEPLAEFDVESHIDNPFCGDEVDIQLHLAGDRVDGVSVRGQGCSISQASGSLMGEIIKGRTPAGIRELAATYRRLMSGEQLSDEDFAAIGDIAALAGVRSFPVRIKCALLAWEGLDEALSELG